MLVLFTCSSSRFRQIKVQFCSYTLVSTEILRVFPGTSRVSSALGQHCDCHPLSRLLRLHAPHAARLGLGVLSHLQDRPQGYYITLSHNGGRQKFCGRKFRRISKFRNFIVRNFIVRNFVFLMRINSVHERIAFELLNFSIIRIKRFILIPKLSQKVNCIQSTHQQDAY